MNLAGFASYRQRTGQVQGKCWVDRPQEGCQEILLRIQETCPVLIIVPLDGGSRCIRKVQMSSRRSVEKEFNSICAVWEGFMEEVPLASGL